MDKFFEKNLELLITSKKRDNKLTVSDLNHFPTYLYKYRTCNQAYNFEMIEEDYVWADYPNNFCDPYDSLVNLKLPSEMPIIKKWMWQHLGEMLYHKIPPEGMFEKKNGITLDEIIEKQKKFTDSKGRYSAQKANRVMLLEIKKQPPNVREYIQKTLKEFESPSFEKMLEERIQDHLANKVEVLRDNHLVCCLSKRKDNLKMWEEYADRYTGFVIEYDIAKANACGVGSDLLRLFPVKYYKRMPKVPLLPFAENKFYNDLYGKSCDITEAQMKLVKQLIVKRYDYRAEEEWRIISAKQKISFPAISSVYAGYKISDEHLQKLSRICKAKGVPLYKQAVNIFAGTVDFEIVT